MAGKRAIARLCARHALRRHGLISALLCERSTMDSVVASEAIDLGSIPSARTSLRCRSSGQKTAAT